MHSQRKVGLDILREKISFQRKTESLDWKKIASIDIESLIQEGDTTQLAELISCVTFCKADSEFDHDRIDPGFIKVFRISQLISECLLASHEGCGERFTSLEEKYNESEKEKGKLLEEILQLKETLTSAKKELKKRKEMLASSQNEILGQNNSDEYDQCPYCTKRFLSSGYLLAHIQRRHQGLPVNPLYPTLPPGGTTAAMLCHHHLIQSQTLPNQPPHPHQTQTYQQSLVGMGLESPGNVPQSPHLVINHHQQQSTLPVLHVPSSPMLYGINQLVTGQQNTPSFSGSVTSLNQIASTHANNEDGNGNFPNKEPITKQVICSNNSAKDTNDEGGEEGERRPDGDRPKPIIEMEKSVTDIGIQVENKATLSKNLPKMESSTQTDNVFKNVDESACQLNQVFSANSDKGKYDNDDDNRSSNSSKVSNSTDDNHSDGKRGKGPKPIIEMEKSMTDIGIQVENKATLSKNLPKMESSTQTDNVFKNVDESACQLNQVFSANSDKGKYDNDDDNRSSDSSKVSNSTDDNHSDGERGKGPKPIIEMEKSVTDIGIQVKRKAIESKNHPKMESSTQTDKVSKNVDEGAAQLNQVFSANSDKDEDDISDYTLSESLALVRFDPNENHHDRHHHHQHPHATDHDHPRGKSSLRQTPPTKKKYMFNEGARKIIEISANSDKDEDDNDDDDERSSNSSKVNNSTDDNDSDGERDKGGKSRKSQMDLVRAKTIMELEENMADIGLNPESTAIGLEEMGRALKHLKSQRRTFTGEQIQDQEKFELERNAVKSFANFEATKSTIDEKLDAISTLNRDKPQQNSFVRMFSAVKISGKNLKKRVASAVKRRQKEHSSADSEDDENDAGGDAKAEAKRKRKATSAPVLKTTFFSKARWTRKKKAEGTTAASSDNKASSKGNSANKNREDESKTDSESGESSEDDSGEDIVPPPFMTRSKPVLPRRNSSTKSFERKSRNRKSSSDSESVKRGSRSSSHSKLNKPLKRLNTSSANSHSSPNSSPSTYSTPRQNRAPQKKKKEDYLNVIDYKKDDDEQSSNTSEEVDNSEDDKLEERYKQLMLKKSQLTLDRGDRHRPATRRRDSSESSPFSNVDEYEGPPKDTDDDVKNYESQEELSSGRTTSKTHHPHPSIPSGHFETVQVKPVAQARVIPVNDKVADNADSDDDLEGDINALLNVTMSDDDKRVGYQRNQPQQPRPSSPFGSNLNKRNVGAAMIQPTQHGGLQRSNLTGMLRGERGGIRSTQLTVHSRADVVSPSNSWDSWK